MMEKTVIIKTSLDARKAAEFVQTASKFEAEIFVNIDEKKINAKSIMGVMALNMQDGQNAIIIADGSDEGVAVDEIVKFLG